MARIWLDYGLVLTKVCLENDWGMARVWLEYASIMWVCPPTMTKGLHIEQFPLDSIEIYQTPLNSISVTLHAAAIKAETH